MAHLIDKSSLVAEIKRRIKEIDEIGTYLSPKGVLTNLLCHLDTLEVKEVDLEKESLTWEDIPELFSISEQLKTSWWFRDDEQTKKIGTQVFWEEVLKRFKAKKEIKI